MLLLFSYSRSQPSFIYSGGAEMRLWRGTGEMHDPCSLQRCPRIHSHHHPNLCNAVHRTILTSPFLWHSPTTHSSPLRRLSTKMEVADLKHGRLMTGPSPLHDVGGIGALGCSHTTYWSFFFSLDDPTFALLPSHAPPCLSCGLTSRCTTHFQAITLHYWILHTCTHR